MRKYFKAILAVLIMTVLPAVVMASGSTEAETTSSEEEITLRLVHWVSEDTKRAGFEKFEAEFIKRHPNVKFENQSIPFAQYPSMLKLKIAADDMPDIIFGKPLSDFQELSLGNNFLDLTGTPGLENIDPAVLKAATVNGKVYGVPFDATFMGLFYNKAMLAEYGIAVPKTYSELVAASEKFMENGIYPFAHAFQNGNQPFVETLKTGFPPALLASDNMDFYEKVQNGETTFGSTPIFKTFISRMAKLFSYAKGDEMGSDNTRARRQFSSGERPFMIQGTWAVGEFRRSNPSGEFGFIPMPWSENAAENKVSVEADDCFMGANTTKYPELVREFLAMLATETAAEIWFENTSLVPSLKNVIVENLDPMFVDAQKLAADGMTMSPPTPLSGEAMARTKKQLQLLVSDPTVDINKWIANLDADIETALIK